MSVDAGMADILLVELRDSEVHFGALSAALSGLVAKLQLQEQEAEVFAGLAERVVTCYLKHASEPSAAAVAAATEGLASLAAGSVEASRLRLIAAHAGAAAGQSAGFHYVVRTDVEPGGEGELEHWYDLEHMPLLAAVPGTVRARRLVSLDAAPRFYACYDLVSPDVLSSAEWLRVRQTPWSQRVRPTFRNTRRVVSKRLPLLAGCAGLR